MAFKNIFTGMKGYPFDYAKFICDTNSDIYTLPNNSNKNNYRDTVCAGSIAYVISENDYYMLNTKDEWIKTISGGHNDGISFADIASLDEVIGFIDDGV